MATLIALKRIIYAGRARSPGVEFAAKPAHARVLVAARMARLADQPQPLTPEVVIEHVMSDADVLRAEYERRTGKAPDKRWGPKRLAKEIAAL
jgi:hypothetical protein